MISTITSSFPVTHDFANHGLANDVGNAELAQAIKENSCTPIQSDQLKDILSSSEKSEQFFNDPMVQEHLVKGLITDTHMDEKVLEALQTCTPSLSTSQQQDLFDNQFSWLSHNPPTPKATVTLRFFADIPAAEEMRTNPKFSPYQSAKRSNQALNGQATFEDAKRPIVCRHLAIAILDEIDPDTHKISYDKFNSAEKIAKHIKSDIETRFAHIRSSATEAHLIKNANWGPFIASQFEPMDRQGIPIKKMLVTSSTHAMAAWLRIKEKDGKKCYVIHFYDPNSTTTHARAKAYDLENVKSWALGRFIKINGMQQYYYPEAQAVSMIYVVPKTDGLHSQNQAILPGGRKLTSSDVDWDAITLFHLMQLDFAGTLRDVARQINTLGQSGADLLTLLGAKSANGPPGLFIALLKGRADTIRAYGELLKEAMAARKLSREHLLTLLGARDATGTPGLLFALLSGHADAIRAYGELLKEAMAARGLSREHLLTLLSAKDATGWPGLLFALQKGHADAIRAYGELLTTAGISGESLVTLLNAKGANGFPGLFMALKNRYTDAVLAYCEIIVAIAPKLDRYQKNLLLTTLRRSHSRETLFHTENYNFYNQIKKEEPNLYAQFKATKNALKQRHLISIP